MESLCVLSDSGTITEEASLLNLSAITIRNSHERPEGMDVGTLIMSGLKSNRILDSVEVIISHQEDGKLATIVPDYLAVSPSKQILRVVLSYIDYVNVNIWHKS